MKRLGIIGGIGPESTIDYYRSVLRIYREREAEGPNPSVVIYSVDLVTVLNLIEARRLEELTKYFLGALQNLASAGANFGLLAANAPHIVFDELQRRSPLPLISIVEATCAAAEKSRFKNLGLFGAKFTMEGTFYQDVFSRAGIRIVPPAKEERAYIHEKYLSELVKGVFLPQTRECLLEIARQMKQRDGIEAIILGGTELPLIFRDPLPSGIHFLDTTTIHAAAAVDELLP